MELTFGGLGGPRGWPEAGCSCASCGRAAAAPRRAYDVVLDGCSLAAGPPPGARAVPGGYAVGARLLYPDGPGAVLRPEGGPYDVVLLDLAADPFQLGALRRAGTVNDVTRVVSVHLDHRWPSPAGLTRRLDQWGVVPVPDGTRLPVPSPASGGTRLKGRTVVIGGSRSGKSEEAELRLAAAPYVTYVATGPRRDDDPSWRARIDAHRQRRPAHWRTEETADLAHVLTTASPSGALLIDGIGTWLTAVMDACEVWNEPDPAGGPAARRVDEHIDALIAAWRTARTTLVAVTDEVGGGLVPETPGGRYFRDVLGALNQRLAAESEHAVLVVAGRAVELPG